MTRNRSTRPNAFSYTTSTGTSRRSRTERAQERRAPQDRLEDEFYRRNIAIGQELGFVDRFPAHEPMNDQPDNEHHDIFEPTIGSYAGYQIDETEAELPSAAHAAYHRARRYAETREITSQRWSQLEESVTATFLLCQKLSRNWTCHPGTFVLPSNTCTCDPTDINIRNIDLYDILRRTPAAPVPFCKCLPDVVRLIHYGYLACSPEKPRTAFSIPLIQFHHLLWQSAVVSTTGFVKAISAFLDSRSQTPSYARGSKYRKRNLRVPFSYSADLYSRILLNQKKIFNDGLQLTKTEQWANQCPRCFGSSEHEIKVNPNEPDIILALDGNFQQRHYAYASKDNPPDAQYPPSFIPPSDISVDARSFVSTEVSAIGIDPPCADTHKAANDSRGETTWEKCDDNGLFASTCRHDIPLLFVNIHKTGEKLYYPVSIIRNILADFPQHKVGILYDLGCHLESHVRKRNLLSNRLADLSFGTSVFHAYVHEWSCQVKYNPRLNQWWGLSDGEGLERLWAFLSPLVSGLRVSTRLHRLQAIQSRADYYSQHLNEMAATWLLQKLDHAEEVLATAVVALAKLHSIPNPHTPGINYTNQFLEQQWSEEQQYHLNSDLSTERKSIELGRLLCLEEELDSAWETLPMTPAQTLSRAITCATVARQLEALRSVIGNNGVADNLNEAQRDQLSKVWYSKTELRRSFLALVEEKQPLLRVCRPGESSTLGTRGQQKIADSLHKRAGKLRTVLETYNRHTFEFIESYPDRPAPPTIQYPDLLRLQPDDSFWNDGLFTNANEPWAVDSLTQQGIRSLASCKRAIEEKRRLGWEARRTMRWATEQHLQFLKLIEDLFAVSDNQANPSATLNHRHPLSAPNQSNPLPTPNHPNPEATPRTLHSLLTHPSLATNQTNAAKINSAAIILHSAFISICSLQLDWNDKILDVFQRTTSQVGDNELLTKWHQQVKRIKTALAYGVLSGIPGDMDVRLKIVMNGGTINTLPLPVEDDTNEDDASEEAYHADVENILSETMLVDLAQDTGTNVAQ
ncbi:uncharacterized protein PGTG_16114 [Puccinia graminis f. sp. tritici CRL 75-36-700-3]|uniref:CxC1-like cysteine cluster associated with KDZ transposases domain-containing protein n=1 Tax=Puccinia graminis f. sp. tritici (strain CRL 75-36-700-3 / race SCCL) TaxID=418459 RepID=E3L1C9_PUCGT|nr:uncharacterized protein PGTG_16114 [Puccinia graminis f. sp. tritici CRL 75-36-700-3]EFP90354.2 hypothetical protein PGTG_16114 [Puccinia graminis f. sp. tritici CRL 75-36-700-3]